MRKHAVEPLSTFLDFITYVLQIKNAAYGIGNAFLFYLLLKKNLVFIHSLLHSVSLALI